LVDGRTAIFPGRRQRPIGVALREIKSRTKTEMENGDEDAQRTATHKKHSDQQQHHHDTMGKDVPKPGQKFPTPTPGFGDRVFYETLFRQRPKSAMAQEW
jgi:hypothetical protein